ncbi:hypothetical protein ABFS83_07G083600 [Erythranthe nasuta]
MYSSRDNWERLVTAVVQKQQIWELFHSNSISTVASSVDDDDFNEQFLESKRWAVATYVSRPPPLQLNNPPTVSPVGKKSGGANITRKLFPANWYKRKKPRQKHHIINIPAGVSTFSLDELKIATDNFSDRNILSKDGFNMSYKGRLANGVLVAIKRYKLLQDISPADLQRCKTEVETMSMVNVHPNLLPLIGVCVTQQENLLVYPYMANGSVASCLRDRPESQPPLDWSVRKRIALGAARGLAYLHDGCEQKIIHRDVKAANIYLNEDFEAIIGNFEFAVHMDHGVTHVEDAIRGTSGHIAPEYLMKGTVSEKSDVYGYGIFLLELITGQRAFDLGRLANDEDVMLLDWVRAYVHINN